MNKEERKQRVLNTVQELSGIPMERFQVLWSREEQPTQEETAKLADALLSLQDSNFEQILTDAPQ
ncbi:hypothetical protein [Xanthomonas phage RTH11]|nr:hypothetical protein [Xanthomonas phage RTH11]